MAASCGSGGGDGMNAQLVGDSRESFNSRVHVNLYKKNLTRGIQKERSKSEQSLLEIRGVAKPARLIIRRSGVGCLVAGLIITKLAAPAMGLYLAFAPGLLAASVSSQTQFTGMCDASAAVALNNELF